MARVIIEVKGGMVHVVHTDLENLQIDVLDYDNLEDEDCVGEEKVHYLALEEEAKSLPYKK